jgi:hypothetical protein
MAIALKSRVALAAYNQNRANSVLREAERQMNRAGYDLFVETVQQFSGPPGQPDGDSRRKWLEENRPFAKYERLYSGLGMGSRPLSLFAQPNPVGVLSGDLLNSLSFDVTSTGPIFKASSYSEGVDYVKYLLEPEGTDLMVPRLVTQHMQEWARIRMSAIGADMVIFMRTI